MLAVKLHKKPKPWLGKGSYLLPITTWPAARVQVQNWIKRLPYIRFISLIKVPDEWPIAILGWIRIYSDKPPYKPIDDFKPVRAWPVGEKRERGEWGDASVDEMTKQAVPGDLKHPYAEMTLGAALPTSCIKWTKDVRVLYRGKAARPGNRRTAHAE